jgi:ABC-type uncharacterized transport system permease subunit
MSTQNAHQDRHAPEESRSALSLHTLAAPVRFVGFWSAIVLPLALFPMLLSGLASEHLLPFAALVTVNLVALVVGRDYHRD